MRPQPCERCRERAATVHWTLIGPSAEISRHHSCDACYRLAQAERVDMIVSRQELKQRLVGCLDFMAAGEKQAAAAG